MSDIKAIEKLREFVDDQFVISGQAYLQGMAIANSIEAEIAEKYMQLPVDVDGVPIRVGDYLQLGDTRGKVAALTYCPCNELPWEWQCDTNRDWYNTKFTRHAEPRTVEDVLEDFLAEYDDWDDGNTLRYDREKMRAELFEKYADEIRELLGGDAE